MPYVDIDQGIHLGENKVAQNGKSNFAFLYIYIKYGKFWSILLGHSIKQKPHISEELVWVYVPRSHQTTLTI